MKKSPNIVSLVPSTTEIVCALGMQQNLVGRSHECDFPASVTQLPYCTEPKFEPDGTSYEIDQRVKALLQEGLSVYRVDVEKLAAMQPDIILTQDHCEVCAVPLSDVEQAVRETLHSDVKIMSVSPTNLQEVLDAIRTIATALGVANEGQQLVKKMRTRLHHLQTKTKAYPPKKMLCLEWLNPLMTAGNWVPELVSIAGGTSAGATPGSHSPFIAWQDVTKLDADIIAIMPCGYSIKKTLQQMDALTDNDRWAGLKAVKNDEVFILEGNQYFNRPGPRLVESACILAEILHPDYFETKFEGNGWISLEHHY